MYFRRLLHRLPDNCHINFRCFEDNLRLTWKNSDKNRYAKTRSRNIILLVDLIYFLILLFTLIKLLRFWISKNLNSVLSFPNHHIALVQVRVVHPPRRYADSHHLARRPMALFLGMDADPRSRPIYLQAFLPAISFETLPFADSAVLTHHQSVYPMSMHILALQCQKKYQTSKQNSKEVQ